MTATAKPTKFLSARILIPAVSALALSWGAPLAKADTNSDQLAIKAQLDVFANQVAAPGKAPAATSLLTAKADDLVLAVYQLIASGDSRFNDANEIANLVASALSAAPDAKGVSKVRADKDKIVARLVDAAVNGLDATAAVHTAPNTTTSAATVQAILSKVLMVNSGNTKFQLTAAGKASAVTQALKDVANPADGAAIANAALAGGAISTSTAAKDLQTFTIATLKTIGTNTDPVKSFVEQILNSATGLTDAAAKDAFAINVAAGLSANPNAVGEVIGAAVSTKANEAAIEAFLKGTGKQAVLLNPKFAKAIPNIVASAFKEVTDNRSGFVTNILATQTKVAGKGLVAAGLLQGASAETTHAIIGDAVAALSTAKATDKAAFAAAAATGNGNNGRAAEVATEVANTVTDAATKTLIGAAIVKSIAATGPEGAKQVADNLINSAGNAFADVTAKTNLAAALAKAVSTNSTAAGSAVAGVAFNTATISDKVAISAAAIKVASKAATGITSEVAGLAQVTDKKGFAVQLATLATPTVAGAIAAGAALVDLDNTGQIAVDIAKISDKTKAQTLTIAKTVATAVDVEHVADVGQRVTALIALGTDAKVPKATTLPALASTLAKLIQSKPNVLFSNRVDELSELAAAMVAQVVSKNDQKLIGAIGSSIIKALSAKLLPNSSGRQADYRDAVASIAGSIAQAISFKLGTGTTADNALKGFVENSVLLKALQTAAGKAYAADVANAFNEVKLAGAGNLVPGDKLIGEDSIKAQNATLHGKYEIGSVIDDETPIKNI